jgi:hypothetical protein
MVATKPPAVTITKTETTEVVVARGRSIQVGDRVFRPGETVAIPVDDYPHILATGFCVNPDEKMGDQPIITEAGLPSVENLNPAQIGMQERRSGLMPGMDSSDPISSRYSR